MIHIFSQPGSLSRKSPTGENSIQLLRVVSKGTTPETVLLESGSRQFQARLLGLDLKPGDRFLARLEKTDRGPVFHFVSKSSLVRTEKPGHLLPAIIQKEFFQFIQTRLPALKNTTDDKKRSEGEGFSSGGPEDSLDETTGIFAGFLEGILDRGEKNEQGNQGQNEKEKGRRSWLARGEFQNPPVYLFLKTLDKEMGEVSVCLFSRQRDFSPLSIAVSSPTSGDEKLTNFLYEMEKTLRDNGVKLDTMTGGRPERYQPDVKEGSYLDLSS